MSYLRLLKWQGKTATKCKNWAVKMWLQNIAGIVDLLQHLRHFKDGYCALVAQRGFVLSLSVSPLQNASFHAYACNMCICLLSAYWAGLKISVTVSTIKLYWVIPCAVYVLYATCSICHVIHKKHPKPTLQEGGITVIREERRDSEI